MLSMGSTSDSIEKRQGRAEDTSELSLVHGLARLADSDCVAGEPSDTPVVQNGDVCTGLDGRFRALTPYSSTVALGLRWLYGRAP